jgi:DNA-binding IclR family transcriptional regulator
MEGEATGPQVVARVGLLLRALGPSEPDGLTTTEVARRAALPRPSVHRLLSSLRDEGIIDRDVSGRWCLGAELFLLGSAAAARYDITRHARDIVQLLARETAESAFLSARSGDQTVCLLREDGSFPLRSHVLFEGIRLPLGVASAGLAILSHMPAREVGEYLSRADLVTEWGDAHGVGPLTDRVAETRANGYALNPGLLVEGSWGIGAAVFAADGRPAWALSLTGVETRFRPDRQQELGGTLLRQAHQLSLRVQRSRGQSAKVPARQQPPGTRRLP